MNSARWGTASAGPSIAKCEVQIADLQFAIRNRFSSRDSRCLRLVHPGLAPQGARRHGLTMMELIASAALIGVVLLTVLPTLGSVTRVRRESAQRQLAVREVGNVLERIAAARLSGRLSPEYFDSLAVSPAVAASLTDSRLQVKRVDVAGPPAAKQVIVSLAWTNDAGAAVIPVTVTTIVPDVGGTP